MHLCSCGEICDYGKKMCLRCEQIETVRKMKGEKYVKTGDGVKAEKKTGRTLRTMRESGRRREVKMQKVSGKMRREQEKIRGANDAGRTGANGGKGAAKKKNGKGNGNRDKA